MYMIFDLETTGLLHSKPYIVSIAYKIYTNDDELIHSYYEVVEPPNEDYEFPIESVNVHGITTDYAKIFGISILQVIKDLHDVFKEYKEIDTLIAHNIAFDIPVLELQLYRFDKGDNDGIMLKDKISHLKTCCTMMASINITNIERKNKYGKTYIKQPKLSELYTHLFNDTFNAHNAKDDVDACARCYIYMKQNSMLYS